MYECISQFASASRPLMRPRNFVRSFINVIHGRSLRPHFTKSDFCLGTVFLLNLVKWVIMFSPLLGFSKFLRNSHNKKVIKKPKQDFQGTLIFALSQPTNGYRPFLLNVTLINFILFSYSSCLLFLCKSTSTFIIFQSICETMALCVRCQQKYSLIY